MVNQLAYLKKCVGDFLCDGVQNHMYQEKYFKLRATNGYYFHFNVYINNNGAYKNKSYD